MELNFPPLKAEDVDVRVSRCNEKGCALLLFKDARVDMRMLDEHVGPLNWQRKHEFKDGKLYCSVGVCREDGQWVWKEDVGTPSTAEADKGHASDSFKRACFNWGIGRELYTAPFIWVPADKCSLKQGRNGKMQCYDTFKVTEMEVDEGEIVKLQICNMSRRGEVVYGQKPEQRHEPSDALKIAYRRMGEAIDRWCERHGITDQEEVKAKKEEVKKRPDWEQRKMSLEYINQITAEFDGN